MAVTRLVLKATNRSDGSTVGFLLPLGSSLDSMSGDGLSSSLRRGPSERDFVINGTAVNTAASPVANDVTDAIDALRDFLQSTTKDIVSILLVSHTSASPLGTELSAAQYTTASAAWTELEDYPKAFSATNSRYDVLSYSFSGIVLPVNFSFSINLQNHPTVDVLRIVLKATDRSDGSTVGFLLPAGGVIESLSALESASAGVRIAPKETRFSLGGLATNYASAPTESEITAAIAALQAFLQSQTKDIVEVLLVHYSNASALGTELSAAQYTTTSAAWTQVKSFGTAYANNGTRFDVVGYTIDPVDAPARFGWRIDIENRPRIETTRVVLLGVETSSNTNIGYVFPVGARLTTIASMPRRNNLSGLLTSPVREESFRIMGEATNRSTTPTEAEILTAVTAMSVFMTDPTISVTSLLIVDYTDATELGASLSGGTLTAAQAAWTVKKTYATAYATSGARFELSDYSVDGINFPINFGYSVSAQNFPISDIDRFDPGNLRGFGFNSSRSASGMAETTVINITARANDGGSVSSLLAIMQGLKSPGATVNVRSTVGAISANQPTVTAAIVGNIAGAGSVLTALSVVWDKFSKEIVMIATFVGPLTDSGPGTGGIGGAAIMGATVSVSVATSQGLKFYSPLRQGADRIVQRAVNPSGSISLSVVVSSNSKAAPDAVRTIIRSLRSKTGLVATSQSITKAVSGVSVDGVDMVTLSATFAFENLSTGDCSAGFFEIPKVAMQAIADVTLAGIAGDNSDKALRGME